MESTASSGLDLFGQVCDYAAILDPFGVAKAAVGIARMIQVIAQKCKANKARCQLLGERAKVAEQLMGNLMSLNLTSELVPRLKEFGECLFEAEKLVGNFHGTRGLKRVLKVGAFEKGFEIVGKRLDFCFQSMNLAVATLTLSEMMSQQERQIIIERARQRSENQRRAAEEKRIIAAKEDTEAKDLLRDLMELMKENTETTNQIDSKIDLMADRQKRFEESLIQHLEELKQGGSIDEDGYQMYGSSAKYAQKFGVSPHLVVPYFDIAFTSLLSQNDTKSMYRGIYRGQPVLIKELKGGFSDEQEREFAREVLLTSRLNCRNITQMIGACFEKGRYCLLLEYMESGDLEKCLIKQKESCVDGGPLSLHVATDISINIAKGLQFLHSANFIHRKLCPQNILLDDRLRAKISNFRTLKASSELVGTLGKEVAMSTDYFAPERLMFANQEPSTSWDMYGLGMLILELFVGKQQVQQENNHFIKPQQQQLVQELQYQEQTDCLPKKIRELILSCLDHSPHKRPSADDIVYKLEKFQKSLPCESYLHVTPRHTKCKPACSSLHQKGKDAMKRKEWKVAYAFFKEGRENYQCRSCVTSLGWLLGNQQPEKAIHVLTGCALEGDTVAMGHLVEMNAPDSWYWKKILELYRK